MATRPLAEKFGLTPARFDLICCALRLRLHGYQANIARSLGVSQVTVCKMVQAMERSGLIRRERIHQDVKKWRIRLTKAGRRRFYLVLRRLQRRPLQRLFQTTAVKVLGGTFDDMLIPLSDYAGVLRDGAHHLGDVSTFTYPDWLWFLD
ncbi:MAG: MarR family transcriptional regulator [Polyangiaceae bacterium]